ncbi:MAG TPA: hypothetical protein PLL23_07605 [Chitinophagaceae bacterium]|nr:hypothetical protein [Chitinophagaceae bacterium]
MLQETIDRSYKVFAKYKPERPLDVCTDCCMTPDEENTLATLPLKEITAEFLAKYNDSAKPAKTSIDEVKYFLPRYFDLIGQFRFPSHSAELSFSRLAPFDKSEWTVQEQDLLKQFSIDFFNHCLKVYPIPAFNERIDCMLIMFWNSGFDISNLLTCWQNVTGKESVFHFRDLYLHGFTQNNPSKLSNSFGEIELADLLRKWLQQEDVKKAFVEAIEKLILEEPQLEETDGYELNLLYDQLRA